MPYAIRIESDDTLPKWYWRLYALYNTKTDRSIQWFTVKREAERALAKKTRSEAVR